MTAMPLCDCAISMDADLQDDINVIDRFVEKYMEGCDVVYGVRNKRETDTFFKRTTAEGFYKFMKILGVDVVFNHADYRLMSRRALEGLSEYKEVNLFLRGIVPLIGFKSDYVYYDRAERFAGESKYPLKKMISFALDGITSFSVKPLKLISNLGILISVLSIFGLLYALISHLCGVTVAAGQPSSRPSGCSAVCKCSASASSAATSAKFTAKSSSAPVSSSKPISKPNRKKKSWTNTDTLIKPDPELSQQFGISFPAAHGMLSLRGTFYEKIRFRSFQIFPRLRFRLRFCIAPVFYAMYIRQKTDISALKYRSASVRHRPFLCCFCPSTACNRSSFRGHRPTVSSDVLIYGLCLLLFSAQLYISYNIYFETGWDAGLLTENARNLMHKHSVDIRYFSNYPNNLLYFFFELFVFKLNKYFSIFSDTQQALCVITVNCALNTLSCLLVYKTAARLTRKLYAFFGFFLAVLSFGLSPWNVICYTDALGLIFPILTLYVFIRPAKHKWLSYVLSAIIGTLGYFIKPQCFILLIAVFLIEGIYALSEKHLLKPLLLSLLTVAITFFAVKAGTGFLCSHYHIQLDNEQSFGIAHFWMMGLNPETKGVYSAEDVRYSRSFVTASERTQANIAVGKQRLQEMGFFGTLKQLAAKNAHAL